MKDSQESSRENSPADSGTASKQSSIGNFFRVFRSWRMMVVLLVGFASGLPLLLVGSTLKAWMTEAKVDLTTIGFFSLVSIPYSLKFLWSPLMDRYVPPFLGRRRGWMLVCQAGLVVTIAGLAFTNPSESTAMVGVIAVLVAFFSASQDIVIDAYRTEIAKEEELGAGNGLYVMGYRFAMIVSSGLALIMADHMSWTAVYLIMAGIMALSFVVTFFAPEPPMTEQPPTTLRESVVDPFVDYFKRRGALEMLIFIMLFKFGDVIMGAMTTPFMIQTGFTKTDIGTVNKIFGMIAVITGGLFGGGMMGVLGMKRSLWIFGILQAASNLAFMYLAHVGNHYPTMVAAIAIENFCGGMGTVAYSAFMMSLCNRKFTATQYALLTSLMAATRDILSSPSGWLAERVGWEQYFLISALCAIPGLLMLLRYNRWTQELGHDRGTPGVAVSATT